MKKRGYKRVLGLKKWNKIVSFLVKGYKKSKTPYEFSEVRKEASAIYLSFKKIPLSKLTQKKVRTTKSTLGKAPKRLKTNKIRILATDIPKKIINDLTAMSFFHLGDGGDKFDLTDFNRMFPDVPILIKTPKNEFKINGKMGGYGGSELAKFVNEQLREEFGDKDNYTKLFESAVALQEENELPYLLLISEDMNKGKNKKELKKLLKSKVKFPKKKDRVVKEVEKIIETEKERKERVKAEKKAEKKRKKTTLPKKKPETKKEVDKKKPKKVSTKKPTTDKDKIRLAELRVRELELLRADFKDGIYTKAEYKVEREKLLSKYSKGGLI